MEVKQQPPYPLRINAELRESLEKEAEQHKRSLNAEIAARLEASFRSSDADMAALALRLARLEADALRHEVRHRSMLYSHATTAIDLLRFLQHDVAFAEKIMGGADEYAEAFLRATEAIEYAESFESRTDDLDRIFKLAAVADQRLKEAQDVLDSIAHPVGEPSLPKGMRMAMKARMSNPPSLVKPSRKRPK